jgi:sugar fermentation stimulation protein A
MVFIIQMKGVRWFAPNDPTHAAFGETLRKTAAQGVRLFALDCLVTKNSITAGDSVPIRLEGGSPAP